jgi:hypothetical protein
VIPMPLDECAVGFAQCSISCECDVSIVLMDGMLMLAHMYVCMCVHTCRHAYGELARQRSGILHGVRCMDEYVSCMYARMHVCTYTCIHTYSHISMPQVEHIPEFSTSFHTPTHTS